MHILNRLVPNFRDPVTTSWLLVLIALFALVVVLPLIRLVLSATMYAVAAISGNHELRARAARMMPRIGHLIGSLVVGVASIAAPAIAQPQVDDPHTISIDRATDEADPQIDPVVETAPPTGLYVVKAGDSLWSIAAGTLDAPTDAQITETWKAIWRANRMAIGDRPELIRPGTELIIDGGIA